MLSSFCLETLTGAIVPEDPLIAKKKSREFRPAGKLPRIFFCHLICRFTSISVLVFVVLPILLFQCEILMHNWQMCVKELMWLVLIAAKA